MAVIRTCSGGSRAQQALWQNNFRAEARAIGTIVALANSIEAVAGCDNPCAGGGAIQIFAEVLEYCRVFGGAGGKVVEGFVDSGREACGCNVVAEYPLIDDLSEKSRLRGELLQHVRDVVLSFRGEGLLIACSSAKGDDDD